VVRITLPDHFGQANNGGFGNIAVVKKDPVSCFDFIAQKVSGLIISHPVPAGSAVFRVFQIIYGKGFGLGFHEPVVPGFFYFHGLWLLLFLLVFFYPANCLPEKQAAFYIGFLTAVISQIDAVG
jgi:hypothetical protein